MKNGFYVYILKSLKSDRYYIGSTSDIKKRLKLHNGNHARWTKRYQPWKLIYKKEFPTRGEEVQREREIKKEKNVKKFLEKIES